jgi:hypothetical protein
MPATKAKKSTPRRLKPLWRCPECGNRFGTENAWHSCGTNTLKALFAHSDPKVLKLFRKFARMVQACGPAKMLVQQTRVLFQDRARFAGAYPRKWELHCVVALPRKLEHPRFTLIENYGDHFMSHHFKVESEADLNDEVQEWLHEAYRVGRQEDFGDNKNGDQGKAA